MQFKIGIGEDAHAFDNNKKLILAGLEIKNHPGFKANSDGDIIIHSITNAISSITGKQILGEIADRLCQAGDKNSQSYLKLALADLGDWKINNIAISLEGLSPKIYPIANDLQESLAKILNMAIDDIAIVSTTGNGLSSYSKGEGMKATTVISVKK